MEGLGRFSSKRLRKRKRKRESESENIAWEEKEPGSCCTMSDRSPLPQPCWTHCLECLIFIFSFPSTHHSPSNLLPAFLVVSHPKMLTHEGALPSFPSLSHKTQQAGASFHTALHSPSDFSCSYFFGSSLSWPWTHHHPPVWAAEITSAYLHAWLIFFISVEEL